MKLGTGWIGHGWDEATLAVKKAASALHLGATAGRVLPDEAFLKRDVWVTDQGSTEACTAHMGVRAIYGLTGEKCSPAVPWWAARLYDAPGEPLRNTGVSMAAFLHALQSDGAAPEGAGPEIGMFDDPPALARQLAQQGRRNLDLLPVWGTNDAVLAAVRAALADGLPVGIAVLADEAYRKPKDGFVGPQVGDPDDPENGWHETILWGYRNGPLWSLGSWGTKKWEGSIGGCVWLDPSRIAGSPSIVIARGVS